MIDIDNLLNDDTVTETKNISQLFEQDSRRFNRALTEEQEVNAK